MPVITGGASGIGKEFAKTAAKCEMKLVLADIQQNALDAAVADFKAQGVDVIGLRTDVSKSQDIQALADAAINTFGKVNLLFNNAGVTSGGLVWEQTEQDWDWVLSVNLHGVIHGVRIFTPLMLAEAKKDEEYRAHIVNTASMAGLLTAPSQGIYNVSKHAVVALSEALYHDLELVTDKVHCSVLCPSYVQTNIGQSDRNRPQNLVNRNPLTTSQSVTRDSVLNSLAAGDVTAEQVSQVTFDGIQNEKLYIYPSPQALTRVQMRMEDIIAQRNPTDWFSDIPSLRSRRERLIEALR
ncbi:SDR family oxidoreductase (plasmid) [Polaromonas sp. P1-6]|nr:SDR family oxidoreductase [Polaromonas sp. P1-6]